MYQTRSSSSQELYSVFCIFRTRVQNSIEIQQQDEISIFFMIYVNLIESKFIWNGRMVEDVDGFKSQRLLGVYAFKGVENALHIAHNCKVINAIHRKC